MAECQCRHNADAWHRKVPRIDCSQWFSLLPAEPGSKITRTRLVVSPGFAELVMWEVPEPVSGSPHRYKYRLAYVVNGVCRMRYDNEVGKGDHRHLDGREGPYAFRGLEQLLADFWRDVNKRR